MESLVITYLKTSFWADSHSDIVYERDRDNKIYSNTLLEEIEEAFALPKATATACIEIWISEEAPSFDLEKFWADTEPLEFPSILPIAQRVAAQTMAHDLVAVQPMEAPTGLLTYLDFQYSGTNQPNQNNRHYQVDSFDLEVEPSFSGAVLDHPTSDAYKNDWMRRYSDMHVQLENNWGPIISGLTTP